MKRLLAAVSGFGCLLSVSSANADITFCNNYTSQVWIATGNFDVNDTLACVNYSTDEMIGWYSATPGNCVTVFSGCYQADEIEYFATAADGAYWAGGDLYGSLSYSAFDFCYGTTHCYGSCPSFNYGPVGFRAQSLGNCGWPIILAGGTIDLN